MSFPQLVNDATRMFDTQVANRSRQQQQLFQGNDLHTAFTSSVSQHMSQMRARPTNTPPELQAFVDRAFDQALHGRQLS